MGHLTIVRHGQASFFGKNYDQLSPIGHEQARALGRWLAHRGEHFDRVVVGPRQRHRETEAGIREGYVAAGLPLPAADPVPEVDEHDGLRMMQKVMGRSDADADAFHPGEIGDGDRQAAMREFFRGFEKVFREWTRGERRPEGVENWAEFQVRVLKGLDLLCQPVLTPLGEPAPDGGRTLVVTSGGFVAQSVGWLLDLQPDRVADLSFAVRNTSLTEVQWSARRRTLVSFNALPHLTDSTLV